jgi:hypothetical protein
VRIQNNFYTMTAYANMLVVEAFASWDESVVRDYIEDLRKTGLTLFRDKPWAILSNRSDWYLYTPAAEALMREAATTITTRLTHIAVVVGKSAIKQWQTSRMLCNETRFSIRYFESMPEAEAWLATFGYRMLSPGNAPPDEILPR